MENRKTAEKKANWKISGALAALLAAVAAFTVMLQMEKKVLTQYERGSVLTAIQEVPRGILLTEENWQQYFAEKQIDKSVLPEKAVTASVQIIGYRPVYDIASGTLLTENMFENFNIRLEQFKEPVIAGVKADDIYQVAGGILRAGDVIQIYSVQAWEKQFRFGRKFMYNRCLMHRENRLKCGQDNGSTKNESVSGTGGCGKVLYGTGSRFPAGGEIM